MMKRAESKQVASLLLQLHVSGNHIHNVATHSDFLDYLFRIIHFFLLIRSRLSE